MITFPDMTQGSEEWFAARRGRPTASEFDKIITAKTLKPSSQREDYALKLIGEILRPDEQEEFWGNKDTDRGVELEPLAREEFAKQTGLDVRTVGFVTRDDEVVGCSPDSLVAKSKQENPVAGLEIKCPRSKGYLKHLLGGGLPDEYKLQVHGSMAVTGLKAWYFMSYCQGLPPFIHLVRWDETTDKISEALDDFLIYYAELKQQAEAKIKALRQQQK